MAAPPLKTPRTCSQCGNNGHNARTCTAITTTTDPGGGFMLFGVRLTAADGSPPPPPPPMMTTNSNFGFRKSVSMNNLSQYYEQHHQQHQQPLQQPHQQPDGYASDDAVHVSSGNRNRERKRGVAWTEEEHKLFLVGLKKVGKGDWRGISRNFVKTRTPTQVASHAQKYFLRRTNLNRRRRRSSLFDITTDAVTNSSSNEDQSYNQDSISPTSTTNTNTQSLNVNNNNNNNNNICTFPKPYYSTPPTKMLSTRPSPLIPLPPSSKMASLNLNHSPSSSSSTSSSLSNGSRDRESKPFLSLKLSSEPLDEESAGGLMATSSGFGGFKNNNNNGNGDSIISVA